MDKEIKDKWIDTLKNGDYKQGTFGLRSADNKFCSLGVLCDVVDNDRWQLDRNIYLHLGESDFPDPEVLSKAGLTQTNCVSLIRLNDNLEKSFNEIADWIEENL